MAAFIAPRSSQPPREEEGAADRNTLLSMEPVFEVKNYAKELEELEVNGVISLEERRWIEEVLKFFYIDPGLLVDYARKRLPERMKVLENLRLDFYRVKEKWIEDRGLDPEKVGDKLPPPSYVAEYVAEAVVGLKLLEPVVVWIGEESEIGLKVGRLLHYETDFSNCVKKLALCGLPHYTAQQLDPPLRTALIARAKPVEKWQVNPSDYLNSESGAVDLYTLTLREDVEYVFTYELPPVNPSFLRDLKEGRIEEVCFASKLFYQIIRKHYREEEWLKLKRVLGSILVPEPMKLLAIVKGDPDTRKTYLLNLIKKTLKGGAAVIRLESLKERFALSLALGARVILSSEESETIVRNVDILNYIVGGDTLYSDRKFKPPTNLEDNPIKMMIFTNEIPVFKRWKISFVDRLVIIETENPQKPSLEEREKMREALKHLGDFMEFLFYCYWDLVRSGYEIPEKGSEKYIRILLQAQSNVFPFVEALCEGIEANGMVYKARFSRTFATEGAKAYDIYCEWCRLRGEEPVGRNTFYQLFEEALRERGVVRTYSNRVLFRGVAITRGEERELPDLF